MACCAAAAYIIYSIISVHQKVQEFRSSAFGRVTGKQTAGVELLPNKEEDGFATVTFRVSGMTCASCTSSITKALESRPGVLRADVSLPLNLARVAFEKSGTGSGTGTAVSGLQSAIEDCGFQAEEVAETEGLATACAAATVQHQVALLKLQRALAWSLVATGVAAASSWVTFRAAPAPGQSISWCWSAASSVACLLGSLLCCAPIHREAWAAVRSRRTNMSLLTSCALQVGLLDSVIRAYRSSSASSSPWDSAAFDSLTLLATVLLGGRYAKALLSQHTFAATASLAALLPSEALVVAEDEGEGEGEGEVGAGVSAVRHIPPSMLRVGDVVLVHPNTAAPCDGDVVTGSSEMLEACLNGGTVPRPKRAGDPVFTGCVNLRQTLKIQVTRAGKDTWLEKALETTLSATRNKSSVQALSETAAEYFVLVVFSVMLAACSLEAYYHFTDMSSVLHRACLILLSACPCTLGLSVPSCIMVATGVAARHGVLMSPRPSCLQAATTLRMIMLDKTGTLTRGNVKVKEHHMSSTVPPALHPLIFKVIFQAEIGSQHPIATALRQYCAMLCAEDHAAGLRSQVHSVHTHHGLGVSALVNLPPQPDPATIRIGSLRYMQWSHCTPAPDLEYCIEREPGPSPSPVGAFSPGSVYIALDSTVICTIQLTDPLEPSASRFVSTAHSLALSVGILTGDTLSSVVPVAASLSIPRSRVWASCLPHDKARIISGLKERYSSPKGCVAMVGDNMNDIPALSAADLSIAVATDAFQLPDGVADALILNSPSSPSVSHTIQGSRQEHDDHSSSLPRVLFIISLLARTSHIIQQNVLWALCYNTVVLFLSSGLGRLIGLTWDMSPLHAALGMSLSSLAVLANSLRLEGEDMWPLQRSRGPGKSGVDLMRG